MVLLYLTIEVAISNFLETLFFLCCRFFSRTESFFVARVDVIDVIENISMVAIHSDSGQDKTNFSDGAY